MLLLPDYVAKYANKDAAEEGGEDTESEDELSSVGSYESGGEEPAGTMDDVWKIFSSPTNRILPLLAFESGF